MCFNGNMEQTIRVLNDMVAAGVIAQYAIGGAIAALFYVEPFETHDLDVFVVIPPPTGAILSLASIYDYLQQHGHTTHEHECVVVSGVPVQFLVAGSPLVAEAIVEAHDRPYGAISTRVMSPEHLVAIMLETGRPKDKLRIGLFLQDAALDQTTLLSILKRYDLETRWQHYLTTQQP